MHLNVFVKNNSVIRQAYLILVLINKEIRESTFITPRGGDEDVLKKAHIFTGLFRLLENFLGGHRKFTNNPVQVIGKFSMPPSRFLKFSMPPPPNSESKEYNPEFSLTIDTICSSSRCLIYSSTCSCSGRDFLDQGNVLEP